MTSDGFVDLTYIFICNQVVMFIDAFLIILAGISILKYSSKAVPDLETIIFTIGTFTTGTVRKTMLMIILVYLLFGQICHYVLCYYQYGFFFQTYALLRSCIVFLNGFIINEQQIFLSIESVENLIRYNGFFNTFFLLVTVNIIIR